MNALPHRMLQLERKYFRDNCYDARLISWLSLRQLKSTPQTFACTICTNHISSSSWNICTCFTFRFKQIGAQFISIVTCPNVDNAAQTFYSRKSKWSVLMTVALCQCSFHSVTCTVQCMSTIIIIIIHGIILSWCVRAVSIRQKKTGAAHYDCALWASRLPNKSVHQVCCAGLVYIQRLVRARKCGANEWSAN